MLSLVEYFSQVIAKRTHVAQDVGVSENAKQFLLVIALGDIGRKIVFEKLQPGGVCTCQCRAKGCVAPTGLVGLF